MAQSSFDPTNLQLQRVDSNRPPLIVDRVHDKIVTLVEAVQVR